MKTAIVDFLRTQLGTKPAILGLSGGIDSAVVAYLLAETIPIERIYTYHLPSDTNDPSDATDSQQVASALGLHYEAISIDLILASYTALSPDLSHLTLGNLKARIRMSFLYSQANQRGGMVVGTGNKTELQLGYFTKYGDGGVDLLPIAHLYKTQVWELAKELGIAAALITKAPSAGLWAGQTDEAELGVTYVVADQILQAIAAGASLDQFEPTAVNRVKQLMQAGLHKQSLPPHL